MDKDVLQANFGTLHARHVAALTRHLVECRRVFDGDMDLFLVMTIIGERSFTTHVAPDGMSREEFQSGSVRDREAAAINLQSIADYSGIPRETVRRKIEILIAKGWVERDDHKFVTATDTANAALTELTDSSVKYLRDMIAAWQAAAMLTPPNP